jgi:hypothetical protein
VGTIVFIDPVVPVLVSLARVGVLEVRQSVLQHDQMFGIRNPITPTLKLPQDCEAPWACCMVELKSGRSFSLKSLMLWNLFGHSQPHLSVNRISELYSLLAGVVAVLLRDDLLVLLGDTADHLPNSTHQGDHN